MHDHEMFLQGIKANYHDIAYWAIYADWLEEQGDPRASIYRRPRLTNAIGMVLALIPPGTFLMGSPLSEKGRGENETQHRVTLTREYYLGVYPVTQAQWRQVMDTNPSHFKGDDLPVESVSWEECQDFCRRLSAKEGAEYRLPTEAEWEYACRAGTITAFCCGDREELLGEYCWYRKNSGQQTHPVGQKQANAWGLYDMHGLVWEWCADWDDWTGRYMIDAVNPTGPKLGSARVNRGGAWRFDAYRCRASSRHGYRPASRLDALGLRLAMVPSGAGKS